MRSPTSLIRHPRCTFRCTRRVCQTSRSGGWLLASRTQRHRLPAPVHTAREAPYAPRRLRLSLRVCVSSRLGKNFLYALYGHHDVLIQRELAVPLHDARRSLGKTPAEREPPHGPERAGIVPGRPRIRHLMPHAQGREGR